MKNVSLPSKGDLENALETVMDYVLSTDSVKIESYIEKLREQNPGIGCDDLAKKVLHRYVRMPNERTRVGKNRRDFA